MITTVYLCGLCTLIRILVRAYSSNMTSITLIAALLVVAKGFHLIQFSEVLI